MTDEDLDRMLTDADELAEREEAASRTAYPFGGEVAAHVRKLVAEVRRLRVLAERAYPGLRASSFCSAHRDNGPVSCRVCYPDLPALLVEHVRVNGEVIDERNSLRRRVAELESRPSLFRFGDFVLSSGRRSLFKIDCDALADADWEALAARVARELPPFGEVEGVPRGGLKFANALRRYSKQGKPLLIADDVCTTGGSLERHRDDREAQGIVVFDRGFCPEWVESLCTLWFAD